MKNLILTTAVFLLTAFSVQAQINMDVEGDGKISGGLTLGNTSLTTDGTLRYNGSDVEALLGGSWTSLTAGGTGSSVWTQSGLNITYNTGNVGIGAIYGGVGLTVQNPSDMNSRIMEVLSSDATARFKVLEDGRAGFNTTSNNIGLAIKNPSSSISKIMEAISSDGTARMTILEGGNVGIGETNPQAALHIRQQATGIAHGMRFTSSEGTAEDWYLYMNGVDDLTVSNDGVANLTFHKDTRAVSVGAANTPVGYMFSVDGKVACEEVLVDLSGDWPDYVFEDEYELKSLAEVQKHINEKGHLPGVPSAEEVETNGIQVGEMNKILMEKVEELTLYILDQEKRIKMLEQK